MNPGIAGLSPETSFDALSLEAATIMLDFYSVGGGGGEGGRWRWFWGRRLKH